jgi:thiol:disulfide interchange protein DsbD
MKKITLRLLTLSLLLLNITAHAFTPLPVDDAFKVSTKFFGDDTVVVTWNIAPGHYLYKDRATFKLIAPESASIGKILMPNGQLQENVVFGKYEAYSNRVTIPIPIIGVDGKTITLAVSYQGCAEDGYCYPPTTRTFDVNFTTDTITQLPETSVALPPSTNTVNDNQEQNYIQLLTDHHLAGILLGFLGFGILLSFTPCVLPMLPILSGIILGHKHTMTTGKAFRLSLVYVISMALTYAVAGILVGFIGGSIQALLQKTWILILFSLVFVLLALSFFGFYQIKLPTKFEEHLANLSHKQKAGHYAGVAIMGCIATLIVSPCVTPALVGVLGYIGQTGDAMLGGLALFTMGIGMGIPLIIMGTAGGKLLPKAGHWMQTLESSFGVVFLLLAIWILERILPGNISMMLYAVVLIVSAIYMGVFTNPTSGWHKLWKGLGLVFLLYGALLLIGAVQGNSNVLQPLQSNNHHANTVAQKPLFTQISNFYELEQNLKKASAEGKPAMLDFYADWCIACKEMEHTTFQDPSVIKALSSNFVVLQIDVTKNTADDQIFMKQFGVVAPPTLVFFDENGNVLKNATLVGKIGANKLVKHLQGI